MVKRLFWGMEIDAPWPQVYPPGKILDVQNRHLTLAFIGMYDPKYIIPLLKSFPEPPFELGLAAKFEDCIFLPPKRANVVAWEFRLLTNEENFSFFLKDLEHWLIKNNIPCAKHKNDKFLPHITIARQPSNMKEWRKNFSPLPLILNTIHLFSSEGHSQYTSLWKKELLTPFEEIEHTADIAFKVRGENLQNLFINAQIAIAFKFPVFVQYLSTIVINSIDDIIFNLNKIVAKIDADIGSPLKAISYHGSAKNINNILEWEMIIDV